MYVSSTDYRATFGTDSLNPVLGKEVSGTNIRSNTRIDGGFMSASSNYGYLFLSQNIKW